MDAAGQYCQVRTEAPCASVVGIPGASLDAASYAVLESQSSQLALAAACAEDAAEHAVALANMVAAASDRSYSHQTAVAPSFGHPSGACQAGIGHSEGTLGALASLSVCKYAISAWDLSDTHSVHVADQASSSFDHLAACSSAGTASMGSCHNLALADQQTAALAASEASDY